MSVSAISGGASAVSKVPSTRTAKPSSPQPKADAGATAAVSEKSGKIDVKG